MKKIVLQIVCLLRATKSDPSTSPVPNFQPFQSTSICLSCPNWLQLSTFTSSSFNSSWKLRRKLCTAWKDEFCRASAAWELLEPLWRRRKLSTSARFAIGSSRAKDSQHLGSCCSCSKEPKKKQRTQEKHQEVAGVISLLKNLGMECAEWIHMKGSGGYSWMTWLLVFDSILAQDYQITNEHMLTRSLGI